jgi:NADP-dependent 3-hydroxy acid dehydrogenase YdfG
VIVPTGVVGGVIAALPLMREQGHGHIVDVCSMTSTNSWPAIGHS